MVLSFFPDGRLCVITTQFMCQIVNYGIFHEFPRFLNKNLSILSPDTLNADILVSRKVIFWYTGTIY